MLIGVTLLLPKSIELKRLREEIETITSDVEQATIENSASKTEQVTIETGTSSVELMVEQVITETSTTPDAEQLARETNAEQVTIQIKEDPDLRDTHACPKQCSVLIYQFCSIYISDTDRCANLAYDAIIMITCINSFVVVHRATASLRDNT